MKKYILVLVSLPIIFSVLLIVNPLLDLRSGDEIQSAISICSFLSLGFLVFGIGRAYLDDYLKTNKQSRILAWICCFSLSVPVLGLFQFIDSIWTAVYFFLLFSILVLPLLVIVMVFWGKDKIVFKVYCLFVFFFSALNNIFYLSGFPSP